jgi:hypothetical protein
VAFKAFPFAFLLLFSTERTAQDPAIFIPFPNSDLLLSQPLAVEINILIYVPEQSFKGAQV